MSTVRPEYFGAKGDGITDDTIPFQTALNTLVKGGRVLLHGDKTYKITAPIVYTYANTFIEGDTGAFFSTPYNYQNATGDYIDFNFDFSVR